MVTVTTLLTLPHTADINCITCCHDNHWQGCSDSMNGEAFHGSHGNCCHGNRYHRGWLTDMSAVTQCQFVTKTKCLMGRTRN